MRRLIVGCGALGSDVARRLVARGDEVFGLRRGERELPRGVVPLTGDVTRPASLALPANLDDVVYAISASERTDDGYRTAYADGIANVIGALEPSGSAAARLLFVSSTGVYGQTDGEWVDEESETEPAYFTGKRMLEAEAHVLANGRGSCCLRLGGIYGAERHALVRSVLEGRATYAAAHDQWTNRIHDVDAARAIEHALCLDERPGVMNVVDADPAPRRNVLRWIAELGDAPAPVAVHDWNPRPGFTSKRVSSRRLTASGFRFEYPDYRSGYRAVMEGKG